MAGLGELLQRIARNLEEAGPRQPADDLRARMGYGSGEDAEDVNHDAGDMDEVDDPESGSIWGPQPARTPEAAREPGAAQEPEAVHRPADMRDPGPVRSPEPSRAPARTPETHDGAPLPSPVAPPYPHASSEFLLSERVRARLRTPDALREAFVTKELLDRPLGLRRTR